MSFHEVVALEDDRRRLDSWLALRPGIVSRGMARRLIESGVARVNGDAAPPDRKLHAGDTVTWAVDPPKDSGLIPEPYPLEIPFEDNACIVVNKPAGMAVHPSPGHSTGTLVHHLLAHDRNLSSVGGVARPGIVHRLDKDTSGLMVAAKTDEAHHALALQFQQHTAQRTYLALVVGRPKDNKGTIVSNLGRDPAHRFRRAPVSHGKRAVTHWQVVKRLGPFTLLRLVLETGRTHQIRAHLAHQDWPVLGDPLYGKGRHRGMSLPPPVLQGIEALNRQALHAARLEFAHPVTGQRVVCHAPLPLDLAGLLEVLEKHYPKAG
ncbi:MAG: RluA family pseudouridine synthase [Deltaproteobacteria bacterium]|nr:RluA family pseudouridine synthase [Deltaproteobacteria bacterium]